MAAKKSKRKHTTHSTSLTRTRAARAVDALTPDFVHWFDEGEPDAALMALTYLDVIKEFAGRYCEMTGASGITAFEADAVDAVMDELMPQGLNELIADMTLDSILTYIEFLGDTDRWTGDADEFDAVLDLFEVDQPDDTALPTVHLTVVDDAEAAAVFTALPVVGQARALLEWIGPGKEVTSTGVLRRKDIHAAAACVGVAVRGMAAAPKQDDTLPGMEASDVPQVKSMADVPALRRIWAALDAAGLISITATRVTVTLVGATFLSGAMDPLEDFVTGFLAESVLGDAEDDAWVAEVAVLVITALAQGTSPEPLAVDNVQGTPEHMPEEIRPMVESMMVDVQRRLAELAALGLVEITEHYRVPPVLARCVADAFDLDTTGAAPRPTAARAPGGVTASCFQLKIGLNGATPPIWRRVLVPADMRLDELHRVIQAVFGWEDEHLHEFRAGDTRFAPRRPSAFVDDAVDEAAVALWQVFGAAKDRIAYTYDFGDSWEHTLTMERAMDDDGGRLPRCTAGRGAGPEEDCGGVWGWAELVRTEGLDATAFDVADADAALARAWSG
ncbi:plasmid pRiA4b ORF-3 family protein [Specibacter cremeus]|uniref:plasmid pRiA4b ORF-3 family protein n=1 Tax=Specibacter cremeus TaxID=1629051 RepID=UPI000F7A1ADE|nr:plasmid pRiA4b ORF-3 family protein [Specibacter cremeus]